jgi:putative sensor protein
MSTQPVSAPAAATAPAAGGGRSRLRAYRNPFRLAVSAGLWSGLWYLLVYLVLGWVLFSVCFVAVALAAVLAITIAGLPMLIGVGAAIRGCANLERGRLRWVFTSPVRGRYRKLVGPGILARVRTQWRDPATWRDIAYLMGVFLPLVIMDTVVVLVWLILLAGITLPVWYRFPEQSYTGGVAHGVQFGYFPHGPNGHPGYGLYVNTLPKALLAAAAFLVLWLAFNYVLLITARAHATVARALLRPPVDPLAEAKGMLARPGPLQPLVPAPANHRPGAAPPSPGW